MSRRALVGGTAAAAAALIGRPSSRAAVDAVVLGVGLRGGRRVVEDVQGKTGVGSSIFVSAASKLTERIEQECAPAGPLLGVDISIRADEPVVHARHTGAIRQPGERALSGGDETRRLLDAHQHAHLEHGLQCRPHPPGRRAKTWEDLLHPKWKGRMTMSDALYSVPRCTGMRRCVRPTASRSWEKLARQDILVRNGSGETTDTIISGERPLARMLLDITWSRRCRRVPISIWCSLPRHPGELRGDRAARRGPNPELGKKFLDFALSREAQEVWEAKYGTVSLRDDIAPAKAERGRRLIKEPG